MRTKKIIFCLIALSTLLTYTACTDDESEIGNTLQDPTTRFEGMLDTIQGSDIYAVTMYDSPLLTSKYTTGMIGHYSDATFGKVTASIYSQLALTTNGLNISDEAYTIDSVVLNLSLSDIYPDSNTHNLHIIVEQLDEAIDADTAHEYFASDQIAHSVSLYDQNITFTPKGDEENVLRLKLNDVIIPQLKQRFNSQDEFHAQMKGLYIALADDSDPLLLTVNFAASKSTLLKAYYGYTHDGKTDHDTINFTVGCASTTSAYKHFTRFEHDYGTTAIAALAGGTKDSLSGVSELYLEPMGGTYIYLNIDKYIKSFHEQHPNAVINYAELLMPTASGADNLYPEQILAYKQYQGGGIATINYASGFDGSYHADAGYYRLRISQYMQGLLRENADYGLRLYLNGRRSSGRRTIINGTLTANPIRIAFVYSE